MYGIGVKFYNKNTKEWSKPYTYTSDESCEIGSAVVVPNNIWYAVGCVVTCTENAVLNPQIQYKNIVQEIKINEL